MKLSDPERQARAADFARRLAATGLSITDFQRRSGLSRNVIYNLSKGQKPASEHQRATLDEAFARLSRS